MANDKLRARQKLSEFVKMLRLTKNRAIVVEGNTDKRFFDQWLKDCNLDDGVLVVDVGQLLVEESDLQRAGLHEGSQRSRVIYVAKELDCVEPLVRCVADRDMGLDIEDHLYDCLLWTDYPAMESYFLTVEVYDRYNNLVLENRLPSSGVIWPYLREALWALWSVRLDDPYFHFRDFKKGITVQGSLEKFDVNKVLGVESGPDVQPNDPSRDIRSFAYGHDIARLLMAAYGNILKNSLRMVNEQALERGFMLSIINSGEVLDGELFGSLRGWISVS